MYHLTRNHKKLLRKNGSKVMLYLCVALALSGGLVSAEGNSIEVGWMGGGEGTIQEGTDETGKVTIHNLMTWGTPEAYVKGKQITVEDASNWGGKIFIGSDATDLVDVKGFQAGTDAETTIDGNVISISIGKLGTGSSTFTIGNKNTNSVVINDFGAGGNSETTINGHNVSVSNDKGQVNIYKGQVTIHTDGNFKVAQVDNLQGDNLQDIGVTEGGNLSITAGSLDAGAVNVTNSNSKADIQVSTKGNLKDIGVTEGGNLSITAGTLSMGSLDNSGSTVTIHADGDFKVVKDNVAAGINVTGRTDYSFIAPNGIYTPGTLSITAGSLDAGALNVTNSNSKADIHVSRDGNLQDIDVTAEGNLSITAGSLNAGHLLVTNSNSEADIHITGDEGLHLSRPIFAYEGAKINIDSPLIRVDRGETSWLYDSMNTTNSTISLGNDFSQIVMNGRLFNAGSDVTLKGKTIHIKAWPGAGSQNAIESTNGKVRTTIGNENTENVYVDGKTVISGGQGNLSMAGRNISLSYPKGVALTGSAGNVCIGQRETENLVIHGQVADQSADTMQLSGQHITIDSTGYDGSENGGLYPESLLALNNNNNNNILAGTGDTQTISISSGLHAMGGGIQVQGKNITVGTSDYFRNKAQSGDGTFQTGYIAYATGNNVYIGSDDTDTVHLYGGQLLAGGGSINIQGNHISVDSSAAYIKPDSSAPYVYNYLVHNYLMAPPDIVNIQNHDRLSAVHALGGSVQIGSKQTDDVALRGGTLLADGGNTALKVLGRTILIDSGNWWSGETNGGKLAIGFQNSDSISIHGKGGIYARGGEVDISGKKISIHADTDNALMNNGGTITVGGKDTEFIDVSGGIVSHGSQISLEGKNVSISKGKHENAIYTDGGTVSIRADGNNEAHISGPITNDMGNISISLSGKPAYLNSPLKTNNDYGKTDLSLSDKASWNLSDINSNFTTYTGDDGIIHLDNETHQTVTISTKFNDNGTRIHEDIYGSKNTGNDTIYIDNSYTGNTHFWLVNRDDTDKGVVGTVLASALKKNAGSTSGAKARMVMAAMPAAAPAADHDPIADFEADHFAAYGMNSLFFKTYGLGIKASDRKDYTKDLYIMDVTNHVTNDKGQYTPTVSAAFSGSSLMYYTWRTENDKMLQRVGDLRENEGEETGLWTRIRGSRIGRDGYRGFKNQYKVYEIGYDAKTEDNDRMKSFTGIALSYLDGKGYYADGQGTNQATSAAIYHADIHKTGHYLDLVFRIRHMNERFHTRDTVDTDIGPVTEDHSASLDTTGLSFSAEYGRKKFMGKGWYVEPQTQWTLGYLGPVQYEMDNGTRVEQPGITSFVGRAGFNLGRQVNENSIVYLKANVYHEFGGHSPIHLYAGDESLSFTDTFDDTWFEYGVGFAMKLGSRLSLYGDFEKSAGSHFYKDWQWNAGIRYSF